MTFIAASVAISFAQAAARVKRIPRVPHPRGVQVRRAGRADRGGHVGEQELQALEVADRPSELLALPGVDDRASSAAWARPVAAAAMPSRPESNADRAIRMPIPGCAHQPVGTDRHGVQVHERGVVSR